jgi:hypothetical protein
MATTYTEATKLQDVIKMEGDFYFSRETLTIKSGVGLTTIGMILEDSSGEEIQLATAGNANAIALEVVDATSAAKSCLCLVRHAVVDVKYLDYNSKTVATVDAALKALDIIPRTGPTYSTL